MGVRGFLRVTSLREGGRPAVRAAPNPQAVLSNEVPMNCVLLLVLTVASSAASSAPTSSTLATEEVALRHARELLRSTPLVDGHNDTPWLIRDDATSHGVVELYDLRKPGRHETDLARLRAGGVSAQFWSVWIPSLDTGSARLQL